LTKKIVDRLSSRGLDIKLITRSNRIGFKAGALERGISYCKGEFIAVFDADFVPQKEWLLQTIPYFKDAGIGVVQNHGGHFEIILY
jgi:cellulose synthase/poly-beta-1,6-N-acetylglucosamine synthase-like glycosyltransferase